MFQYHSKCDFISHLCNALATKLLVIKGKFLVLLIYFKNNCTPIFSRMATIIWKTGTERLEQCLKNIFFFHFTFYQNH